MNTLLWIAAGGAIGSVSRYMMAGWMARWMGSGFPWGTLLVNVSGSLCMGMLFQLFTQRFATLHDLRAALLVGVLGGYTTFSTFSIETLNLLRDGSQGLALLNIMASVALSVLGAALGLWLAKGIL